MHTSSLDASLIRNVRAVYCLVRVNGMPVKYRYRYSVVYGYSIFYSIMLLFSRPHS